MKIISTLPEVVDTAVVPRHPSPNFTWTALERGALLAFGAHQREVGYAEGVSDQAKFSTTRQPVSALTDEQILLLVCEHTGKMINLPIWQLEQHIEFARTLLAANPKVEPTRDDLWGALLDATDAYLKAEVDPTIMIGRNDGQTFLALGTKAAIAMMCDGRSGAQRDRDEATKVETEDFHIGVSVESNGTHVQVWDGERKLYEQFHEMRKVEPVSDDSLAHRIAERIVKFKPETHSGIFTIVQAVLSVNARRNDDSPPSLMHVWARTDVFGKTTYYTTDQVRATLATSQPKPTKDTGCADVPTVVPNVEQVQWRNIQKVVKEVADFCFGGHDHLGSVSLAAAHCAVVTSLTAKDGINVQLEPLTIKEQS